jgi:hypothetical protein
MFTTRTLREFVPFHQEMEQEPEPHHFGGAEAELQNAMRLRLLRLQLMFNMGGLSKKPQTKTVYYFSHFLFYQFN